MSRFPANTLTEKRWGKEQSPFAKQLSQAAGDAGGGIAVPLTGSFPQSPSQLMSRLFEFKKFCVFAMIFLGS